jgi:phosphoribosylamine--glycine ligase
VTVVLAAGGYPDKPEIGVALEGIADAEAEGALVFHAGTALRGGSLVTSGGRVLNVTGIGASVAEARERAYRAVDRIEFAGVQYRHDVALRAVHAAA